MPGSKSVDISLAPFCSPFYALSFEFFPQLSPHAVCTQRSFSFTSPSVFRLARQIFSLQPNGKPQPEEKHRRGEKNSPRKCPYLFISELPAFPNLNEYFSGTTTLLRAFFSRLAHIWLFICASGDRGWGSVARCSPSVYEGSDFPFVVTLNAEIWGKKTGGRALWLSSAEGRTREESLCGVLRGCY